MQAKTILAVCGACAAASAPAAAAFAAPGGHHVDPAAARSPLGAHATIKAAARTKAEREVLRLVRRKAHLRGTSTHRAYERRVRSWALPRLRAERRDLRRDIRRLRRAARAVAVPAGLQAIAACESGGDPPAVGGGRVFRGKYQFDYGTWASVGGSGDPAAAPEAEQDRRAARLYARAGASPWPGCGR
jgi:Transglycosylase-like domain